jgi:hypothetical protein
MAKKKADTADTKEEVANEVVEETTSEEKQQPRRMNIVQYLEGRTDMGGVLKEALKTTFKRVAPKTADEWSKAVTAELSRTVR